MPRHDRTKTDSHHFHIDPALSALATAAIYAEQSQQQMSLSYYPTPPGPESTPLQDPVAQPPASTFIAYTAEAATLPSTAPHRVSSGAWSIDDDNQLLAARVQGLNWVQIKDEYFPGKTSNACRKRYERLVERKSEDDWDSKKMQLLGKEYQNMRKEIWSGIAARMGEKWEVVEAMCMSNGLRVLQDAARASSRRERLENRSQTTACDDENDKPGIAGLTPVDGLDECHSSPDRGPSAGAAQSLTLSSDPSGAGYHQHHHEVHGHAHANATMTPTPTPHVPVPHPAAGNVEQASYSLNPYGVAYSDQHHENSTDGSSTAGMAHQHQSRDQYASCDSSRTSSYMDGQRISSADMGIDNIINRSRSGRA
ncbi:hypothetical protein E4U21_003041 [Claviceps maximensis]|nr:hypothetical protein E4U21_003041 [Claviceps maximensis]